MGILIVVVCASGLAVVLVLLLALVIRHQRRERAARQQLTDAQSKGFAEVLDELTSLRSALVATGAAERTARLLPAPPPAPLPSVARQVVSVTRDDDPIHTRPTVEAPPPDEPPSTKPSQSREIPARSNPRSALRPVSFEDQITRAMKRLERQVNVPPEVAKPEDAEGETTLRRDGDRPAGLALPRANADDEDDRDTGEDMTKVYSRGPRPARDPLAGVEPERPTSSAARTAATFRQKRPTLLGGLVHHDAPKNDGHEEGDGR